MDNNDFNARISRVEKMLEQIEDPSTDLRQSEKLIAQSREEIRLCREYLRSEREKI